MAVDESAARREHLCRRSYSPKVNASVEASGHDVRWPSLRRPVISSSDPCDLADDVRSGPFAGENAHCGVDLEIRCVATTPSAAFTYSTAWDRQTGQRPALGTSPRGRSLANTSSISLDQVLVRERRCRLADHGALELRDGIRRSVTVGGRGSTIIAV